MPIILSNRLKAMRDAAENFGDSIDGIRQAQRLASRQDNQDKMAGEAHTAQMKQASNADALQGFALAKAGQEQQDVSSLRSDQNELAAVDSGLPTFGPRVPADETPSPFLEQDRNLRARLMASIESKITGKPVSRDDILARKDAQKQKLADDDYARSSMRAKDEADLAGTKADTDYKLANTKKIEAELNALTKGGVDPDKVVAVEGTLRNQFVDLNKPFMVVRDAWSRIQAADDSGAGDVSMIYSLMKILDPGASVMEGDIANARNTAGIPDKVRIAYNNALEGRSLDPKQRVQFKNQAGSLFEAQKKIYTSNAKTFSNLALDYGVNPGRVVVDLGGDVAGPSGGGGGAKSFKTAREAMAAGLPAGTRVMINGEEAEL